MHYLWDVDSFSMCPLWKFLGYHHLQCMYISCVFSHFLGCFAGVVLSFFWLSVSVLRLRVHKKLHSPTAVIPRLEPALKICTQSLLKGLTGSTSTLRNCNLKWNLPATVPVLNIFVTQLASCVFYHSINWSVIYLILLVFKFAFKSIACKPGWITSWKAILFNVRRSTQDL